MSAIALAGEAKAYRSGAPRRISLSSAWFAVIHEMPGAGRLLLAKKPFCLGSQHKMTRVVFICSQNRLRSPTAEQVFSSWDGLEVASAGLNNDAENAVSPELLEWAQLIFVMEKAHRNRLARKFRRHLGGKRIICLDIPDEYDFMDPGLVTLLKAKVPRHLPGQ